mmetsp:Transcript_2298/g.8518  ORF Transcript_2298/g.8518 Transcript_2298/m.8518 type:complete len:207 (+) Transcript_2298:1662-2282(+)
MTPTSSCQSSRRSKTLAVPPRTRVCSVRRTLVKRTWRIASLRITSVPSLSLSPMAPRLVPTVATTCCAAFFVAPCVMVARSLVPSKASSTNSYRSSLSNLVTYSLNSSLSSNTSRRSSLMKKSLSAARFKRASNNSKKLSPPLKPKVERLSLALKRSCFGNHSGSRLISPSSWLKKTASPSTTPALSKRSPKRKKSLALRAKSPLV